MKVKFGIFLSIKSEYQELVKNFQGGNITAHIRSKEIKIVWSFMEIFYLMKMNMT